MGPRNDYLYVKEEVTGYNNQREKFYFYTFFVVNFSGQSVLSGHFWLFFPEMKSTLADYSKIEYIFVNFHADYSRQPLSGIFETLAQAVVILA